MRFLLPLLLAGCCPFFEPGELREVGSAIGDGTVYRPERVMLYDPKTRSFYMIRREYWDSYRSQH